MALVQKTQAAALAKGAKLNQGTLNKAPSKLEQSMNLLSSPQDRLVAKNPVVQVAVGAVLVKITAPVVIATANTTTQIVEGSAALSFATGTVDGVLKSGIIKSIGDTPPDLPYLFENPVHSLTSDATQGLIYFFNTPTK